MPPWGVSLAWREDANGILEADLGLIAAAHDRALADVVLHAGSVTGRALDDQARLERAGGAAAAPARPGAGRWRRSRRRSPRVGTARRGGLRRSLQRAARDPQQEQVEHGQEAELQADGDRLDDHGRHQSTSKRASTVPDLDAGRRAAAPCGSLARTSRPLTRTPLVEPRSVIVQPSPSGRSSAWRRETLVSARTMSHSRLRPMRRAARRRRRSACPRPRASRGRGARCASRAAPPARGPRSSRPSCGRGRPARPPPPPRARAAPGCRTRPGAGARRCRR